MNRLLPSIALLATLSALSACRVTQIQRPIAATGEVKVGVPSRAWEVVTRTQELAGMVVRFDVESAGGSFYMVRNIWHQDLGLIDAFGRAYRYLPHHKDPAWVGSGTVMRGVENILGMTDCRLFEVALLEEVHAATPGERERDRVDPHPSLTSRP